MSKFLVAALEIVGSSGFKKLLALLKNSAATSADFVALAEVARQTAKDAYRPRPIEPTGKHEHDAVLWAEYSVACLCLAAEIAETAAGKWDRAGPSRVLSAVDASLKKHEAWSALNSRTQWPGVARKIGDELDTSQTLESLRANLVPDDFGKYAIVGNGTVRLFESGGIEKFNPATKEWDRVALLVTEHVTTPEESEAYAVWRSLPWNDANKVRCA